METQEVVELLEVRLNEEEVRWRTEGETQFEDEGGDLDLEQGRQGREEEKWFRRWGSDVERRQSSDRDEMDRSSEEER